MSYLIDGIRHCDLKLSFFSADYDAKKFFRKSIIESGGQAVESWSIWGQKFFFLKSIEMLWKLFQTEKKALEKIS